MVRVGCSAFFRPIFPKVSEYAQIIGVVFGVCGRAAWRNSSGYFPLLLPSLLPPLITLSTKKKRLKIAPFIIVLRFYLYIVFYLFNFLFILTKIISAPGVGVAMVVGAGYVYALAVGLDPMVTFALSHSYRAFVDIFKRLIHWFLFLCCL